MFINALISKAIDIIIFIVLALVILLTINFYPEILFTLVLALFIIIIFWKRKLFLKKIGRQYVKCEECQGKGKVPCKKCKLYVSIRGLSYRSKLIKTNKGYILKNLNASIENNGKFPVFSDANIEIREEKDYGGHVLWKWSKKNIYLKGHQKKEILKNVSVNLGELTRITNSVETPIIDRDIIIEKFVSNSRLSKKCDKCNGVGFEICDVCNGKRRKN